MRPQKALHLYKQLEKKNPKLEGKTFAVMEKLDGWYGYWDIGSPIMSRQMSVIRSLGWLSEELNTLAGSAAVPRGRLIFEILVEGQPVFKDLNGTLNAHAPAKNAYLRVHDFVYDEARPFEDRYDDMLEIVTMLSHPRVKAIPIKVMSSQERHWREQAAAVWDRGGEGVILKDLAAPYSPGKRNADILKIKLENSEEMLAIGAEQGEGKYEGTLGALLVKDQYNVIHRVSGMSDEERHAWWTNLDIIVDKVVEVTFMCRLANGSIREGRFKAVRYNKTAKELG